MKFYDERIQKHLLKGGKIRNNTYEGSYVKHRTSKRLD